MKMPAQRISGEFEMIEKYPDKSLATTSIPGLVRSVQGFNGKVAWESTNTMGLRKIEGKELEFIKFDSLFRSPKSKLKEIFSKIDLDRNGGKVEGKDCYKLTCYPPEKYGLKPTVIYVDKENFYIVKLEIVAVTQLGEIPSVAIMKDFKKIQGLIVPTKTILNQLTVVMEMEVTSIELNKKVDDSIFEMPKE
jgi:hypothetical protein